MNNIFGGVHGSEREKMMKYIDKRLGIDSLEAKSRLNHSATGPQEPKERTSASKADEMNQTDNPEQ